MLAAGVILTGCDSSRDVSKENFMNAIAKQLASECIRINPSTSDILGARSYPATVAADARENKPYAALVAVGILAVKDGIAIPSGLQPLYGQNNRVPAKVYTLTSLGDKVLASPTGTAICVGHYQIDGVTNFTEPVKAGDTTVSRVTYTFSPADVSDWASASTVQEAFPFLQMKLKPHQTAQTAVTLTSAGWSAANGSAQTQ
jgi:hypothetical protein